jgi:malonate transporter and related proteins
MPLLQVIISALVPIAFVVLLGVLAGRTGLIKPESSGVLAAVALDFCLPSLLFNATAAMPTAELQNWRFFLGIALGLLAIYALALVISRVLFRKPIAVSSLQALNSAFPNMAFMGVPVLTAVLGASAVLSVVIGNLISSFVLLPLTLTLLEAGSPQQKGQKAGAVLLSSLLRAVRQPLVWAPLAGILMATMHILGYSLSHSFGAVFDNPDLVVACVVGDGEAETARSRPATA